MAVGHGGQVLLSAAAAALCADGLPAGASLRDLGEFRLKDLGRPERVFQLVHPDLESTFPPLMTIDHGAASLPIPTTAFVGRRAELEAVERYLEDPAIRLLTLTGPGGTGKTSLAIRAAGEQSTRFRDGVSFVDVSACRDADGLILALGRAVGVGEVPARSIREALAERLRERQVLLVLDNFEQVTSAAWVTTELLDECAAGQAAGHQPRAAPRPDRARLPGAAARPAARDPPPRLGRGAWRGSSRSSCSSTGRARSGPTSRSPTTTRRRSSRSAAGSTGSRSRSSSPRLVSVSSRRRRCAIGSGSRLELLRSAARDVPERQQTLRATIDWSYALLEPAEQRVFEGLAVFADADVRAIEAVAAAAGVPGPPTTRRPTTVPSTSSSRSPRSSRRASSARSTRRGGEPRVRMLETIREFATEQLDEAPRGGRRPARPRRLLRRPRRRAPPRPVGRRPGSGDGRDDDRGRELPDRLALLGRAGRRRRADEARQQPAHPQRGARLVPRHGRAGDRHARDPDPHGEHARARRQGDRAPADARPRAHGDAGASRPRSSRRTRGRSICSSATRHPASTTPSCVRWRTCTRCAPSSTRRPRSASGSWRWPRPRTTPTC